MVLKLIKLTHLDTKITVNSDYIARVHWWKRQVLGKLVTVYTFPEIHGFQAISANC